MIMLKDDAGFSINSFCADFSSNHTDEIVDLEGDEGSFVLTIADETVAIAFMDVPIPKGDIEETAKYAYNWQTVVKDTANHKSHLIVSLMNGSRDQIKRFKILTSVICSLLRTTDAIGVYKGNQSLLISRTSYLREAARMSDDYLPLNIWIYFGLRITEKGNAGYTHGLKEFYKTEMEIIDSFKSLKDIRAFLFNMVHYVLEYDVIFEDGQTCGLSADEKISISYSKARFYTRVHF